MKIPKTKAIELIDEKIKQFEDVAKNATYENRYNGNYQLVYEGAKMLLTELFSEEEAMKFRMGVTGAAGAFVGREDYSEQVRDYKKHVGKCTAHLKAYRERVENFWSDKTETTTGASVVLFVAMSFDEADKDLNEYVTGVLNALQINFVTGGPYSKKSIPEKVKSRILGSDLIISIFVKRAKKEGGGYTAPSWLLKELGIAQGASKDIIAWVEQDIDPKELAGLNWEKEVIYFVRDDVKEMEKATIKFLEALKEHKLI